MQREMAWILSRTKVRTTDRMKQRKMLSRGVRLSNYEVEEDSAILARLAGLVEVVQKRSVHRKQVLPWIR